MHFRLAPQRAPPVDAPTLYACMVEVFPLKPVSTDPPTCSKSSEHNTRAHVRKTSVTGTHTRQTPEFLLALDASTAGVTPREKKIIMTQFTMREKKRTCFSPLLSQMYRFATHTEQESRSQTHTPTIKRSSRFWTIPCFTVQVNGEGCK